MKKKIFVIVGIVVLLLVTAGLFTSYADSARISPFIISAVIERLSSGFNNLILLMFISCDFEVRT